MSYIVTLTQKSFSGAETVSFWEFSTLTKAQRFADTLECFGVARAIAEIVYDGFVIESHVKVFVS